MKETEEILAENPGIDEMFSGNWRKIIEESAHLLGKKFKNEDKEYIFFGIVWGEDDFYYGMCDNEQKLTLLSCVGNLETWGFTEC